MGLRSIHLFAGAGGGILGDLLLGHTPVCAVEIEEYPRRVLLQRQLDGILPVFPIWDDVKTFNGTEWRGLADVVCGGFPCQDISSAGKGAGIDGERSGLWSEFARIIREVRPRYVFVENSPMLTSRGLHRVLGDLAAMGFDAEWGVLSCRDVGGVHLRERIWILASDHWEERVQGTKPPQVSRFGGLSWGEDGGSLEDLRSRSDVPRPILRRIRNGVADYVDRISAIGNGQVPAVAALAWRILNNAV